jgi:Xaa-Pro aminopeptidase
MPKTLQQKNMRLFDASTYISRRKKLAAHVKEGVVLLLGNNDTPMNFKDNTLPYRQDSTFLYYFGLTKPGLAAIIDCDTGEAALFGNDPSLDEIVWTGPQTSLTELGQKVGVSNTHLFNALQGVLKNAQSRQRTIHFLDPYRDDHKIALHELLGLPVSEIAGHLSQKLTMGIVEQRLYKTSEEIAEIGKAVDITAEMHLAAMQLARPGMREQEIVSELLRIATSYGGYYAFPPIVTIDGETLHNHFYGNTMQNGDMLLVDSGAETEMGYAGDMTRTFPVGNRFTDLQRAMYTIVLDAHLDAVEALRPGIQFRDVHLRASLSLARGLKALGLMKGDMQEAVKEGAHTMFFQCGLGHLMGLDVHDMENLGEQHVGYGEDMEKSTKFGLKSLRLGRRLEKGFVLTVEPGIYVIPALIDMWKAERKHEQFINYKELEKFRNFGGIRVEEDFVIEENGARRLGKAVPKTVEAIENLINS